MIVFTVLYFSIMAYCDSLLEQLCWAVLIRVLSMFYGGSSAPDKKG